MKVLLNPARCGLAALVAAVIGAAGALHSPPAVAATAFVQPKLAPIEASGTADHFIVVLKQPALASYTGDDARFPAIPRLSSRGGKLDLRSPQAQAYLDHLAASQDAFVSDSAAALGRAPQVMFRYAHAINAVVLRISPAEAEVLARDPRVALLQRGGEAAVDTDAGPNLIGAPGIWDGSSTGGLPATRGEGMTVGIIDSGVNFQSPSFATTDVDGYTHVNPFGTGTAVGTCATGGIDAGQCNDKLIGAYDFVFAVCSDASNPCGAPGAWTDEPSATDNNGHGSHTASTTAGGKVNAPLLGGTATQRIGGVAHRANIIAYDVCYTRVSDGLGLCPFTASVGAINQAIADGVVDVLNFSIGGGNSPWTDSVALAFLGAVDAGISVSTSAGNSGPGAGTVGHREPWTVTNGASTHDRDGFGQPVSVVGPTAPPALQNLQARQGSGPVLASNFVGVPLSFPAANPTGCTATGGIPGPVVGLVLVRRGACNFSEKVNNAASAGASGVLIANNAAVGTIAMGSLEATTIPSAMITLANGNALEAFIAANPSTTVDWRITPVSAMPGIPDVMGGFSSRGPSTVNVLKPDLTNPGLSILAAVAGGPGAYSFLQGTSMSSPHTAGAITLLRALRPTWTPAEVKSALMLTAKTAAIFKENGTTPADPFDRGNGRVQVGIAARTGLVMNETGLRFSQANPATGGDPTTLNLASYQRALCEGVCTFTRRVRSVANVSRSYTTSLTLPTGVTGSVTPTSFTILPGQQQTLTISLDTTGATPLAWNFAELAIAPALVDQNFGTTGAVAIPDNQYRGGFGGPTMACMDIDTSALPVGTNLAGAPRVQITADHTFVGDTVAKLRTPSGTIMGLWSRPGATETADDGVSAGGFGFSANLAQTHPITLRDGVPNTAEDLGATLGTGDVICAANGICNFTAARGSIAGPPNSFADLVGQNARGVWTLCVGDRAATDLGTLRGVTLTLPTAPAEPPAMHMTLAIQGRVPPTPPEITVAPTGLTQLQAPNVQNTQTFTIGNSGETTLNWNLTEAAPSVILDVIQDIPVDRYEANLPQAPVSSVLRAQRGGGRATSVVERRFTEIRAGGSVTLSLDDGTRETSVGLQNGGQIIWLNRFTPAPTTFPFTLTQIDVHFAAANGINVGEVVDLFVYTDADGDPANGATFVGSQTGVTVQALDAFNSYTLSTPITLNGPGGDVLVAVVNRTAGTDAGEFIASIDQTTTQTRSFIGIYSTPPGNPPALPADAGFGEIGALSGGQITGNWMIRGIGVQGTPTGCQAPQNIGWLSLSPLNGTAATGESDTVTVTFDSTGLAPGSYSALVCVSSNDPDEAVTELPVSLEVAIPVDPLFSDGFEDPIP